MARKQHITLKQIAQHAGTSIGTVDRALKNREGIGSATRQRVLAAAREIGYAAGAADLAGRVTPRLRIAMVYPEQPQAFYAPMVAGMDACKRAFEDVQVEVTSLRYASQNQALEETLLRGVDGRAFQGLAINAAGPDITRQINRLVGAGVSVITFNTDAPDSNRAFFVGTDALRSGRMGAELLGRFLGGRGAVTALASSFQATPFSERFSGFCEVLRDAYPDMLLYPCAECLGDRQLAAQNLITLLRNVPLVRGVFCTGFTSTLGAVAALRALNRRDIVLIGYDTGDELLTALREGWCDALLYQNPFLQGYTALQALARYILSGKLPDSQKTDILTHVVLRQNADSYR